MTRTLTLFVLAAAACTSGGNTQNSGNGGGTPGGGVGGGGMTGGGPGGSAQAGTGNMLPCAVDQLLQTRCRDCHGATPTQGAPMSLVTWADVTARAADTPGSTYAQLSLMRMMNAGDPMPPAPDPLATPTEISAFKAWIDAGTPMGSCTSGANDGGMSTAPDDMGTTAAATCTSGKTWTNGDNGSPLMHPGDNCIECHAGNPQAPQFTIAGTLYASLHEPIDCNGVDGTKQAVQIQIFDAGGKKLLTTLTPNAAGNFYSNIAVGNGYHARVVYNGKANTMGVQQVNGDCNACHQQQGIQGAPGRVMLP